MKCEFSLPPSFYCIECYCLLEYRREFDNNDRVINRRLVHSAENCSLTGKQYKIPTLELEEID